MAPAHAGFAPGRAAMPAGRNFVPGGGFHGGAWSGNHPFRHHFHKSFFLYNNGCYYGSCYGGYYGYPAYYPPIFSGFDYTPAYDYGAAQAYSQPAYSAPDTTGLQVQIQHLTDEVEQLREEQRQARSQPSPAPVAGRPNRMDLPTILVYRDGRVTEVHNYGIVGQTLWIFDEQHARKVPLSEVDVPATRAANDDRGGFVLPQSR